MIIVAITREETNYSRIDHIREAFSSECFQIINAAGKSTEDILREAKSIDSSSSCIIIKDNSVTSMSVEGIRDIVLKADEFTYDLCYLASWGDYCHLHNKLEEKDDTRAVSIVTTQHPEGLQAIMYSPSGRNIILGDKKMANSKTFQKLYDISSNLTEEIYNGNISAISTYPPVFQYDISLNAMRDKDFLKTSQCAAVLLKETNETSGLGNMAKFAIAVVIILIVAWAIVKVGPSSSKK